VRLSAGKAAVELDGYALSDIGKTVLGAGIAVVIYLQFADRLGWPMFGVGREKAVAEVVTKVP
jgi:hypothetical protein